MATTNNLQALFGGSMLPEEMQQELINQRAQQFAQLTPSQQLGSMGYKAGAALGGGLAQAMGVDITDPKIKRMSQLQALSQGAESTPEGLKALAQKLQANGFAAEASMAMDKALSMEKEQSIITRNLREPRMNALPNIAKLQAYRQQAEENGATKEQLAQIDAVIKAEGEGKGTRVNVGLSPEIKMTNQELDWRKQFLSENKPVIEQAANVRQSLNLLRESQSSPFADAAFANTVVSAFGGDKQKSKSEIDRLVKSGSLDERVANTVKGFFEGTTSAKTKEDQLKVLTAVDKVLEQRYNSSAKNWSDRLGKVNINPSLVVPDYNETAGTMSAPKTPQMPPEGTRLRNKKTDKIEVVRNGKLVPE